MRGISGILLAFAAGVWQVACAVRPTMCGLIGKQGFTCEVHRAVTLDGYILEMYRIPGTGPPVLLQHGLLDSSFTWVLNDRNQSLAYVLADAGMDVWLGNNRGNEFGSAHERLSTKKKIFWQFTFDEMGKYDLPAMINLVLDTTGKETLSYVGHSQGTMQAWVGFSSSPTLQKKVNRFYALAAVSDCSHSKSPLLNLLAPFGTGLVDILSHFHHGEFIPSKGLFNLLAPTFCRFLAFGCDILIYTLTGQNKDVDPHRIDEYVKVTPSGTSDKNMEHFVKDKNHAGFADFNGRAYNLGAVTVPSVIITGTADILADAQDVSWLVSQLPDDTVQGFHVIQDYAHLDFTWGLHANEKVYTPFIVNDMIRVGILPSK